MEPMDPAELVDSMEPAEPVEPVDPAEPMEPMNFNYCLWMPAFASAGRLGSGKGFAAMTSPPS